MRLETNIGVTIRTRNSGTRLLKEPVSDLSRAARLERSSAGWQLSVPALSYRVSALLSRDRSPPLWQEPEPAVLLADWPEHLSDGAYRKTGQNSMNRD